jgi:hypothetical protein
MPDPSWTREVALIDDDIRELRRRRGRAFAERNAEFIRDLQARDLDALRIP